MKKLNSLLVCSKQPKRKGYSPYQEQLLWTTMNCWETNIGVVRPALPAHVYFRIIHRTVTSFRPRIENNIIMNIKRTLLRELYEEAKY